MTFVWLPVNLEGKHPTSVNAAFNGRRITLIELPDRTFYNFRPTKASSSIDSMLFFQFSGSTKPDRKFRDFVASEPVDRRIL